MMASLKIKRFKEVADAEIVWDNFINDISVNGTFLQTRNFLNYHPAERFADDSLFVYDKGKIAAVIPACVAQEDGKCFFSHMGSTFGGPVISKKYYNAERVLETIDVVEQYAKDSGYEKIVFKPTNALFSKEPPDLLHYCLGYRKYAVCNELATYIELSACPFDVRDGFDKNKVRNVKKCEKHALGFRELDTGREIGCFHSLLVENLKKYGAEPVHTAEEIMDLTERRIPGKVRLYGVFDGSILKAGSMVFVFSETNVLHTQYLCADNAVKEYSPSTYLYYKLIEQARKDGFCKLSWGISTEERGKVLNHPLLRNKESYGSRHCVNHIYEKML